MFDSLKKKLKSVIEKAAASIREDKKEIEIASLEKKEDVQEQKPASMPVEEMIEFRDQEEKIEQQLEEIARNEEEQRKREEKLRDVIEEKKTELLPEKEEITPETREEIKPEILEEFREKTEPELAEEAAQRREIPERKTEERPSLVEIFKEPKKEEKTGFFKKIFEKTITEDDVDKVIKELHIALLENDVALEVAEKIEQDMKTELVNRSVRRGNIENAVKEALKNAMLDVMRQEKIDIDHILKERKEPLTVMFLGFNGTGKTTSLAKFAKKFSKYKPVVAAADTFRAASIEQLEEHSRRVGFRLVKHAYGADPAAVIFDARKAAEASGSRLVLADTAGRSHSNVNLMDELKKIVRVNKPDLKILVLDSLTGNDIYEQSRLFNNAVGVDAIILTKVDVYDKGGAALSATYTIKKPIIYLGVGQEYEDLKEFSPEDVVKNLLG